MLADSVRALAGPRRNYNCKPHPCGRLMARRHSCGLRRRRRMWYSIELNRLRIPAMEIELKYIIPDRDTFERLLTVTELGAYRLREAGQQRLTDHYFDTPGRAVLRGGYAVRL